MKITKNDIVEMLGDCSVDLCKARSNLTYYYSGPEPTPEYRARLDKMFGKDGWVHCGQLAENEVGNG